MRNIPSQLLSVAAFIGQTLAYPRPLNVVRRQTNTETPAFQVSNLTLPISTQQNTLNTTVSAPSPSLEPSSSTAAGQLPVSIVNGLSGNQSLNAYITGLDADNRLVMVQNDGQFHYPMTDSSIPTPIDVSASIVLGSRGSITNITLPGWISAGRIWISEGDLQFFVVQSQQGTWSLVEPSVVAPNDPNINVKYGFVEMTNDAKLGLFVNLSYVDFIGLALGVSVTSGGESSVAKVVTDEQSAGTGAVQTVLGLSPASASQICSDLQIQASVDSQPWDRLCVADPTDGSLLRVLSPADYISMNPSAFGDYWTAYIDQVWETYSTQSLFINTQTAAGNVSCSVSSGQLKCEGDNRFYDRPTAADIFGCNTGPFTISSNDNDVHRAIVPRLCAAINRSTILLQGGNYQPSLTSEFYYTTAPTNFYSKLVHQYEAGGKGYAFSYDDVTPDGAPDQSGLLVSTNPTQLEITIQGS